MRQRQLIWYETIYDSIKLLSLSFSIKLIVTVSMFITFNMPRDNVSASNKFAFTLKFWCLRQIWHPKFMSMRYRLKNTTRLTWAILWRNRDPGKWYTDQIKTCGLRDLTDHWDLDFRRILERIFVNFCKLDWPWHTDSLMAALVVRVKKSYATECNFPRQVCL